jgi:hypothetical protein
MCRIPLIYDRDELDALGKKGQEILRKLGVKLVRTNPEIRNIIKKDLRIRIKLKKLMDRKFKELTRGGAYGRTRRRPGK